MTNKSVLWLCLKWRCCMIQSRPSTWPFDQIFSRWFYGWWLIRACSTLKCVQKLCKIKFGQKMFRWNRSHRCRRQNLNILQILVCDAWAGRIISRLAFISTLRNSNENDGNERKLRDDTTISHRRSFISHTVLTFSGMTVSTNERASEASEQTHLFNNTSYKFSIECKRTATRATHVSIEMFYMESKQCKITMTVWE